MAGQNVITLTEANFKAEVLDSAAPVLVDFWAEWCAPCKMIAPVIDELAREYAGKLKVGKVDVGSEQELAGKFRVQSIPTLLIFKGGQVVSQSVGAKGKKELKAAIDKVLA